MFSRSSQSDINDSTGHPLHHVHPQCMTTTCENYNQLSLVTIKHIGRRYQLETDADAREMKLRLGSAGSAHHWTNDSEDINLAGRVG